MRAAELLAIDSDHFPADDLVHLLHPLHEPLLELLGIQQRKHPPKRIVRWNPVLQHQKATQPCLASRVPVGWLAHASESAIVHRIPTEADPNVHQGA